MPYKLAPNVPVHAQLKFADVVGSQYGPQVKVKAIIAGAEEHVYLPGAATDAVSALLAAGVIAAPPDTFPAPSDTHGIALRLAYRDVVLTLDKPSPRAPARLLVAKNGAAAATVAATPTNGVTVAPGPATSSVAPASESVEAKRAAITAAYRDAIAATFAELVPFSCSITCRSMAMSPIGPASRCSQPGATPAAPNAVHGDRTWRPRSASDQL